MAYNYTSENFNDNYIDFIIQYITKYSLTVDDFFHLFFNGMIKGNFIATFNNMQLKEEIIDIYDGKIIKELITKMIKRKKKKNVNKITINTNTNKIKEEIPNKISSENSIIINEEKTSETPISETNVTKDNNNNKIKEEIPNKISSENSIIINKEKTSETPIFESNLTKDNNKIQNMVNIAKNNSEVNLGQKDKEKMKQTVTNESINYDQQIKRLNEKNKNMEDEISELKNEISELKDENSFLSEEVNKNGILINKFIKKINVMKRTLEIISFRDLSKIILDNMIDFAKKKNKNIFIGKVGRKEKLKQLNEKYNYNKINYMKKPIEEIFEKYYNFNNKYHIPKIVKILSEKPYGLVVKPENDFSMKYYNIMVISKSDEAFKFINDHLHIKKEIKNLYLD